jgi:hypothetical protein
VISALEEHGNTYKPVYISICMPRLQTKPLHIGILHLRRRERIFVTKIKPEQYGSWHLKLGEVNKIPLKNIRLGGGGREEAHLSFNVSREINPKYNNTIVTLDLPTTSTNCNWGGIGQIQSMWMLLSKKSQITSSRM